MINIYAIENNKKEIVYIGQTINSLKKRFSQIGYGSNVMYGIDKSKYKIKLIANCATQDVADRHERYFISFFNTIENGHNKVSGGKVGYKQSDYHKKRMKEVHTGKIVTEETKAKFRKAIGAKRVVCNETGEIFDSYTLAAKAHNLNAPTLYRHLNNIPNNIGCFNRTMKKKTYSYVDTESTDSLQGGVLSHQ